jgi:type 1 fimbriae regulatory protein FimB/type 1 fimbriae regulatory protein FimE
MPSVHPIGGRELRALRRLQHEMSDGLANDGHDTRAIQHYLGHRSIASTVRYTALAPDRFKGFWKD